MISTSANMTATNSESKFGLRDIAQWFLVAETSTVGILLVAVACFAHVLLSFLCPESHAPKMLSKRSTLSRHLVANIPRLGRHYCPPVWARGPHVQTFLAMFVPIVVNGGDITMEREYLQLKDDGLVALEWATSQSSNRRDDISIVLIIPPLWGYAATVLATCRAALDRGFRPVVFHGRGTAGTPLTTPRLQSFGDATDIRQVVGYVHTKWPSAKMTAIGYGMGNGLLFSYLGEYGSSAHISAAVAVSPVWDAPSLFENFAQPYGWLLLALKKAELLKHAGPLQSVVDVRSALRSHNFTELCQRIYVPLYGYRDMEEFWDNNNPLRDVDDIAVPLLVIQAVDDPIVPKQTTPFELFNVYPNFFMVLLERGGHCGFFEGDSLDSWATHMSFDYLEAVDDFVEFNAN